MAKRPLGSEEQVVLDLIQQAWGLGREAIDIGFDDDGNAYAHWSCRGQSPVVNLTIYGLELKNGKISHASLCEEMRGPMEDA